VLHTSAVQRAGFDHSAAVSARRLSSSSSGPTIQAPEARKIANAAPGRDRFDVGQIADKFEVHLPKILAISQSSANSTKANGGGSDPVAR